MQIVWSIPKHPRLLIFNWYYWVVSMGGSNELVECFCGGAVAEGCSGAVARLVGDGVLAVPGRGSSIAIGTRRASLFRARPASSCTRCQTCPGRAHLLAVLQECHRLAGGFAAYPAPYCATGSLPGPRPKARRSPPPPRARGLEQVTPTPNQHPLTHTQL